MDNNTKKEYKVVGKYLQGVSITGYFVEKIDNGTIKLLKTSDVIKLTEAEKVEDAKVADFEDEKILCIGHKVPLMSNENKNTMQIIYRILDANNKCTSYMCKDKNGKNYRIEKNQAWVLASQGTITNVSAIVCKGRRALIGKEQKLDSLPVISDRK